MHLTRVVDGRDDAVARTSERARTVDDLLQYCGEVEARADPQGGRAERRDAIPERLEFTVSLFGTVHWRIRAEWDRRRRAWATVQERRPKPGAQGNRVTLPGSGGTVKAQIIFNKTRYIHEVMSRL